MNKKDIRQIKCLLILLLGIYFSISPIQIYAQSAPVTINMQNSTLERVLTQIEKQTNYLIVYIDKTEAVQTPISVNVSNRPLKEVLDQIMKGTHFTYKVSGFNIIVSSNQDKTVAISGIVKDGQNVPIAGATVLVLNTSIGTTTNADGTFNLQIPDSAQTASLQFSFIGYTTLILPVKTRTYFDVTLTETVQEVEQVVVTALGIKRSQKALAYNVQQIASEDITDVKDVNFMNSLTGKVAGAVINSSSSGIGGAAKVILRGAKSISQNSNALYVIDGIPMFNAGGGGGTEFDSKGATEAIADLNPDDIESISVLTGASAAALYGSNAANGAIMVTTKSGKAGKLNVSFSTTADYLRPFVLPAFQNRYGTGRNGVVESSPIQSWGPRLNAANRMGYEPRDFFETGAVYQNSATLSGGTDRNQTFFSAAAVNSDGIILNNKYDRYNFTFRNTSYFLKDRLKLDAGVSIILQNDQNMTNQGQYSNPIVPVYLFPRGDDFSMVSIFERYDPSRKLMTQYWPQGDGGMTIQNPYWIAHRNLRNNDRKRYLASASLSYKITDWMDVVGRVRLDNANNLYTQKLFASTNEVLTEGGKNGHYTEARRTDWQTYADVMLNINKTFGEDWSLVANIGASVNNTKSDELSYRGKIRDDGLANVWTLMDLDDTNKKARKERWHEQTQSVFASVEVGWKQMLYLTVTGRNDWASQLANSPESSFFYPSVGLSWIPSTTFNMPDAINYLKVRGSFSSVGMPFPRFLTCPTYEYDETNHTWKDKTHYPIGDLFPERTRTWELGVETRLWKHINLSVSWYRADTYNQTFDPEISVSSGYSTIYLQTGHVRNTGVEASLGYTNRWRSFTWDTGFTFAWNQNRIVELVSHYQHPETGQWITKDRLKIKGLGKANYILKPGGTLGDLYSNSDLKRDDSGAVIVDDTGNVSVDDNLADMKLGSVLPDYNLAWRNSFEFKGLKLNTVFTARIGGIVYSATRAYMDQFGVSEATAAARDAGGVLVNDRSRIDPQKYYTVISAQSGVPQYYTYSATNVRLQELSLSYTLPSKWFRDKMKMTVAFVGRNLWMIYNKAPFDPESVATTDTYYQGIDYFMLPSTRNLGFSVKFNF